MKILHKLLISITALALFTLTSCLDDSATDTEVTRFDEVPYVIDFNEVPNSDGFIRRSFDMTSDPTFSQSTTFSVNLSSPYPMDEAVTVTVEYDETAATEFAAGMTGYAVLPSAKQDFTSSTVTIPAGERSATFTVNVFTEGILISDNFVVAYTITAVDNSDVVISGNFGTQYVRIGVANVFEGEYILTDNFWRNSGGTNYSGYMSNPVDFITVSVTESTLDYFYTGWGDSFYFDVDLDNPATIDGHPNAYPVTVYTPGWDATNQEQFDNYDGSAAGVGTVWNYCYEEDDKWIFKICHEAGGWFGYATYTMQ